MTRKNIDASREARLWTCTILSSAVIIHSFLYNVSEEYRDWVRDTSNKLISKITKSN